MSYWHDNVIFSLLIILLNWIIRQDKVNSKITLITTINLQMTELNINLSGKVVIYYYIYSSSCRWTIITKQSMLPICVVYVEWNWHSDNNVRLWKCIYSHTYFELRFACRCLWLHYVLNTLPTIIYCCWRAAV